MSFTVSILGSRIPALALCVSVATLVSTLAACGQKGPLYLAAPAKAAPGTAASAATPPSAASAAASAPLAR